MVKYVAGGMEPVRAKELIEHIQTMRLNYIILKAKVYSLSPPCLYAHNAY